MELTEQEIDYWNMRDDMHDHLDQLLEENGMDGFAKLLIYEDSEDILNGEFPNHQMNDEQMEEITYEWLEKEHKTI